MERHISWDHPGFRLLAGRKIQIGIAVVAAIGLIGSRVLHASNNPSIIGIMATISGLLFCAYVVFELRGAPLREGTNTESHRFVAIARLRSVSVFLKRPFEVQPMRVLCHRPARAL